MMMKLTPYIENKYELLNNPLIIGKTINKFWNI